MYNWWGIEKRISCYSCHSCSKTPNPGRLYTIRTSDCKITKSLLNDWDKKIPLSPSLN